MPKPRDVGSSSPRRAPGGGDVGLLASQTRAGWRGRAEWAGVGVFSSGMLPGRRTPGISRAGRTPGGGDTGFRHAGRGQAAERRRLSRAGRARAGGDVEAGASGWSRVGRSTRAGRQRTRRGCSVFLAPGAGGARWDASQGGSCARVGFTGGGFSKLSCGQTAETQGFPARESSRRSLQSGTRAGRRGVGFSLINPQTKFPRDAKTNWQPLLPHHPKNGEANFGEKGAPMGCFRAGGSRSFPMSTIQNFQFSTQARQSHTCARTLARRLCSFVLLVRWASAAARLLAGLVLPPAQASGVTWAGTGWSGCERGACRGSGRALAR